MPNATVCVESVRPIRQLRGASSGLLGFGNNEAVLYKGIHDVFREQNIASDSQKRFVTIKSLSQKVIYRIFELVKTLKLSL